MEDHGDLEGPDGSLLAAMDAANDARAAPEMQETSEARVLEVCYPTVILIVLLSDTFANLL